MAMFAACGQGTTTDQTQPGEAPATTPAAPTAERVAAQQEDLPVGLQRCGYSGSMDTYLEGIEGLNTDTHNSVEVTWAELKEAGAVDAHVAVYADTPRACTFLITGAPEGHEHRGVRVVSSIVVQFPDPATAEAAYRADIFQQSSLVGQPGVVAGTETGLGPNSVVAATEGPGPVSHQAVWQSGAFNIFFTGQNLTPAEFRAATAAETHRAR